MGLTWIDHDTIEKPIEEITLGTDDAVDIQFTVETLKSANSNEQPTNSSSQRSLSMKPITKKVSMNIIVEFHRVCGEIQSLICFYKWYVFA